MNEELWQIRMNSISAQNHQDIAIHREMAEKLLNEAYKFFEQNPTKYVFSAKLPIRTRSFRNALWIISREEKYGFWVEFGIICFWRVKIHAE